MYDYDPLLQIPEDKQHLVIGGEVHVWSEQIDSISLDPTAWPRSSAAAEILWSGPRLSNPKRTQLTVARRLGEMRERMVARGVMAEPVHMPYCMMEENQCNG
jgi:hexosaminidase